MFKYRRRIYEDDLCVINQFVFFLLKIRTFSLSKLKSYWLTFHLTGTSPVHVSVRSAPDVRVSSGTSGDMFISKTKIFMILLPLNVTNQYNSSSACRLHSNKKKISFYFFDYLQKQNNRLYP